jgi:hypothetical protein
VPAEKAGHPDHAAAATGDGAYLVGSFIVPSSWQAAAAVLRERAATHGTLLALAHHGAPTGGLASPSREFTRGQQHLG